MDKTDDFRYCGDCSACCQGYLKGTVFSKQMSRGVPCHFLEDNQCSLYFTRPNMCKKYFCAWTQGLLPFDLRPDKAGAIVTINDDDEGKQRMAITPFDENAEINEYLLQSVEDFVTKNDTYYIITGDKE